MLDQSCGSEWGRAFKCDEHGGNSAVSTAQPQAFRACLDGVARPRMRPLREMPTGRLREKVIVTRQIIDLHALPAGPDPLSLAAGDGKIKQRPIIGPFQRPVQPSPAKPIVRASPNRPSPTQWRQLLKASTPSL